MNRPVEWAGRINRRWIVHHGLGQRAEDWIAHLAKTDPRRLKKSCRIARKMIEAWGEMGDPKPWFYSGLFHLASEDEAKHFLAGHRLTKATVASMSDDEEVKTWESGLCAETNALLQRLRIALAATGERVPGR